MSPKAETPSAAFAALDPISRISEILFGLIMVLTFTGSLSAASAGREDVREMLIGALGCNFVWGLIDALLYIMGVYTARGRNVFLIKKLRATPDAEAGRAIIREELPEKVGQILQAEHIEHLRKGFLALDSAELRGTLTREDIRAAFFVFALVFLSVFPVAVPFLVMHNAMRALRVSNAIAIGMLVACGCAMGHYTGGRAWIWGAATAVIGIVVVFITIALGG